jgi:peptide/nickel transport system permease protein
MSTITQPRLRQSSAREWRLPSSGGTAAAVFAGLLIALGVLGPTLLAHDPDKISLTDRLMPPLGFGGTWAHPLGTDQLGRDLLARVVVGARISLIVALSATVLAGTIGVTIGLVGGYFGGRLDRLAVWLGDVQLAIPFVVVAIGVSASLTPSAANVVVILGITGWATYARVARLAAQPLRHAGYIDAARLAGAGSGRILFRHLLPVIAPTLLAIAGQQAGAMMLYEAALSYLGLGVPAGTITWGGMVADARETAQTAWWATVVPGLAIVLVVIGFNATSAVISRRVLNGRSTRRHA